ncbi:MAG: hypothetical protein JW807_11870 [Spirochaetes bacterium]|nr:hypothetical protein [Spirochaetota bacterium]
MKRIIIIILFLPLAMTGCSFWKITSLNSGRLVFLPAGSEPGQVVVKADDFGMEYLSISLNVSNGKVCVGDNELGRVQVVKLNGDVALIIGSTKNIKKGEIPVEKFNFGAIGFIAMDEDENIYIQNKLSQIKETRGAGGGPDGIDFSPSYILSFSKSGELQYTLGQRGAPDTPFSHIERLFIDFSGRLFVMSRTTDSWCVFRFKGKRREKYINLAAMDFTERDEGNVYGGKIDNVKIFSDGERMLISVSYYHNLRLKYIKIFEYSIAGARIEKTIMEIPDPKNVLFDIVDDKYLYLWNVSDGDVKFEVANLDGAIVNNVYMEMKNRRDFYTKILLDESGRIYSYHIMKSGVEVLKWE